MEPVDFGKVSVIIPVYQAEAYLPACIASILEQTYAHFELLLIDDGSTDTSGDICDTYAGTDPRISVFHRANHGVSEARNFGLSQIQGDYVLFIDADDLIPMDYIEKLLSCIPKGTSYGLALCRAKFLTGEQLTLRHEPLLSWKQENSSLCDAYIEPLITRSIQGSACRVLYPAALLRENKLRFASCKIAEDLLFFLEVLSHCEEICVCENTFYIYRQTSGSASHKSYTENYLPDRLLFMQELKRILSICPLELSQREWLTAFALQFWGMQLYINAAASPEMKAEIKSIDASIFGTAAVSSEHHKKFFHLLSRKHKVLCFLIMHRLFTPVRILRQIKKSI